MNHHTYFAALSDRAPVEVAIVGTGSFGRSFLNQSARVPGLSTRVAVDVTAEAAAAALAAVGVPAERIAVVGDAASAVGAWAAGKIIAAGDVAHIVDLPIEVVIEATGHPDAGARHGRLGVEGGKHVVMVSKEADSVVGPELARIGRANEVIVTPVDGDQPSLLIGLITWAEVLGLEIVAAGKSSEYDFVYDPAAGTMWSNGVTVPAPDFAGLVELGDRDAATLAAQRSAAVASLPQRTVPDLCEMCLVANATGFVADRADFHAPIARITEVADFFAPVGEGGLISGSRRLDVFHCLRLPGEVSFAGGVFVTVRCEDRETWEILREKGHTLSRDGKTAMLWLPRHLLGVEAATSVLEAAVLKRSSGAVAPRPVVDLVAHADADIAAGTVLTASGHHHSIADVSGRMVPAAALGDDAPVPFYLAANRPLTRAVRAGSVIRCGDVDLSTPSPLLELRQQQDAAFFVTA